MTVSNTYIVVDQLHAESMGGPHHVGLLSTVLRATKHSVR